jgi:hypothetical protein
MPSPAVNSWVTAIPSGGVPFKALNFGSDQPNTFDEAHEVKPEVRCAAGVSGEEPTHAAIYELSGARDETRKARSTLLFPVTTALMLSSPQPPRRRSCDADIRLIDDSFVNYDALGYIDVSQTEWACQCRTPTPAPQSLRQPHVPLRPLRSVSRAALVAGGKPAPDCWKQPSS